MPDASIQKGQLQGPGGYHLLHPGFKSSSLNYFSLLLVCMTNKLAALFVTKP
jgi:hypothetical protein